MKGIIFQFEHETSSIEDLTVAVYEMKGILEETHQLSPIEVVNQQIGHNYSSEIYNIILTQGANSKIIRVIKK